MNDIKKCYHSDDKGNKSNQGVAQEVESLSRKHSDTVAKIFEKPERADLKWRAIEALIKHLGGTIKEGSGSRKRLALNNTKAVFHEPHPAKELDKGAVKSLRKYLVQTKYFDEEGKKTL
jgi:hypothetical protein